MGLEFFSHNGAILPLEQARVPLAYLEYSYGFGVYENIRYSNGIIYFLKDHVERLMGSAQIIGLEHELTQELVEQNVKALVERLDPKACNLKILLIGGPTPAGAQLFIQALNPLFPDRKLYHEGAAMITYEYERAFPHAKTLNMLQSYIAYREAKRAGAYDALLVNRDGNIVEGTRTNFCCIRGQTIFSPPEKDILLGVTRKAMLAAAARAGFEVMHGDIGKTELGAYDGAFITSTSSKIIPIRSVDGQVLAGEPPAALVCLMDVFGDFLASSNGVLE